MNKLIILVGPSGSGKSTFATNYIKEHSNTLRISRDDIRKTLVGSLDGYYQRKDLNRIECHINGLEEDFFNSIIGLDKSIIIDNTNLKQSYLNRWIQLSQNTNYHIEYKLFDISLEEAVERVIIRDVPEGTSNFDASYITKQIEQYKSIKQYLLTYHADQIIYE